MFSRFFNLGGVSIGLGVLLIAAGWRLQVALKHNGKLESRLAHQVTETLQCVDANTTNETTISTLQDRIQVMVDTRRVDTERRERVLVERDRALVVARAEADSLRTKRVNEAADIPTCADFEHLVVAGFCPAAGQQLRDRIAARDRHPDPNGDGTGGGDQTPAGVAHGPSGVP